MIAAMSKRCLSVAKKIAFDRRRLALFLSVLVLLVIGGRWVGVKLRHGWQQAQVGSLGYGIHEYVPLANWSDEFNEYEDWFRNDLIRSSKPWTMDDAERLIATLANPPTEKFHQRFMREETSRKENERYMEYDGVMSSISERIRHNDPMALGVKELLSQTLLDQLDIPIEKTQLDAVQAVANARLVMIPIVRARLEALRLTTDDKRLADTIQAQLARFDYYEQLRREGKYRERGVDIIPAP